VKIVADGETTEKVSEALEQAYYGPLTQQEEEQKNKSLLEMLIEIIRARKQGAAPKLEQATAGMQ
jgi:phosphoribosylpyrophosphate synthetase